MCGAWLRSCLDIAIWTSVRQQYLYGEAASVMSLMHSMLLFFHLIADINIFSTHTVGHFTVLTPLGAPNGEIMLQNVFRPGTYVVISDRVFIAVRSFTEKRVLAYKLHVLIDLMYNLGFVVKLVLPNICMLMIYCDDLLQTKRGDACRLRVHIGADNLVCFEAVGSPGQYLAISQAGTALDPRRVNPGCIEAKFFVRVHVRIETFIERTASLSLLVNSIAFSYVLFSPLETSIPVHDYRHDTIWKTISCGMLIFTVCITVHVLVHNAYSKQLEYYY